MLEVTLSSPAPPRPLIRSRWALLIAAVAAFLTFAVTTPAEAGYYYGGGDYGSACGYRCGGYRYHSCGGGYGCGGYRYRPCGDYGCGYRYHSCSSCGYHGYYPRRNYVYERRYVEREYVERSYGAPHYHHYGYDDHRYGYDDEPYRRYSYYRRPFPYGYGGIRGEAPPYDYERIRIDDY
jgi:hypothetical protein